MISTMRKICVTDPSCDSSGKHNVAFLAGMMMELFGSISRQYVLQSPTVVHVGLHHKKNKHGPKK